MNRLIRYTYPRGVSPFSRLADQRPFAGFDSELNRVFASAFTDLASPRFPVDLYEDKDNTYVRAELPGVSREAINVEMIDGFLNIHATRQMKDESFTLHRSVTIPEAVQADKVTATYENGVLTVTLPKQEQAKPRKIAINVN